MLNVVIFGAPGSGKGTQSELIIRKYELKHISTGEILRTEIKKRSELGLLADEYISKGQLVPDEVIIGMLETILNESKDVKGFIFDGFPRTLTQGEALDRMLREKDTSVAVVLNLSVEGKELVQRLLKRGEILGRSDDNPETIWSRLDVYHNQTEPLKEYYKKQGKLVTIKGDTVEDVFEKITDMLNRIL
ncbi:adenylate kinase [Bacteroidia bacterium]|nr:adenylate kinase [Bacteroidia bacterium]GHV20624.1 adenylate kinase [Bacteroidia bacterium]